jgi:hypothetical protein
VYKIYMVFHCDSSMCISLSLISSNLFMMYSGVVSSHFLRLGFIQFLRSVNLEFSLHVENFSHGNFCVHCSLYSLSGTPLTVAQLA